MTPAAVRVLLVRHPQTVANVEGRYVGRQDSPLTELGRKQTEELAAAVAAFGPEVVFSSPLGRALDCARLVAPAGLDVTVLPALQEIDFGQAEGLTWQEIAAGGLAFDYYGTGPIAPEGEDAACFDRRVREAASAIEGAGERVVVVTHGGVMRRLLAIWLGIPTRASWRFDLPNAVTVELRLVSGEGVLVRLGPV